MMIELPCASAEALIHNVFANSFQQRLGQTHTFELSVLVTRELDSDVTAVTGVEP